MPSFEQKITEFAKGKRLLRLARPIRDRADAHCDACGSTQPRTLYALKDLASERHYFVGDTCLKELAKHGAVLRRYGRESGRAAYEIEIKLRAQGSEEQRAPSAADSAGPSATTLDLEPAAGDARAAQARAERPLLVAVLLLEAPEFYQVLVSIPSASGPCRSWGYGQEARYEEVWRLGGEGGLILERVKEERLDAPSLCLTRAWKEALPHLARLDLMQPFSNGTDGGPQESNLRYFLIKALKLNALSFAGGDSSPRDGQANQSALPFLIAPRVSS